MTNRRQFEVFLSHTSHDKEWASEFASALRDEGVSAWFDATDLQLGERWQDVIQDALRESCILVVIISPKSLKSPWLFFELGAAVAGGKKIIPVLTQDVDMSDIPGLLAQFQVLKESSPRVAAQRVAATVKQNK